MVDLNDPRVFEAVVDSLEMGVYLVDCQRKIVFGIEARREFRATCATTASDGSAAMTSWCIVSWCIATTSTVLCDTACPLSACMRAGQVRAAPVYLKHR